MFYYIMYYMKTIPAESVLSHYGDVIDDQIAKSPRCVQFFTLIAQTAPYVKRAVGYAFAGTIAATFLGPILLAGAVGHVSHKAYSKVCSFFGISREASQNQSLEISAAESNPSPGFRTRNRRSPTHSSQIC